MAAIKIVVERKGSNASEKPEFHVDQPHERRQASLFRKSRLIIISATLIILATGVILLLKRPSVSPRNSMLQETLAQIKDFTPYFFANGDSADGFQLASTNGMVYSDGILFVTLANATNQQVTITEQALPGTLAHSTDVIGDEPVTGVDGKAAIAHVDGHTTGSMISHDHRTLITLNCSNTVASSAVMDLMRALSPITGR